MKSESIAKIALALSKAQSKIIGAVKDANNPFFNSTYADLASVMSAIRGPFSENELSYVQPVVMIEGKPFIKTILMHSSGEFIESIYPIVCKDFSDSQKVGSGTSYARRYALASLCGVPQVDDDANAATFTNEIHEKPFQKPLQNFAPKAQVKMDADEKRALEWSKSHKLITEGQIKRFYAIQDKSKWNLAQVLQLLATKYKCNLNELKMNQYDELIQTILETEPSTEEIPF